MKKTKTVRNEREFLEMIGADDRKDAEHKLYKYTDCGAWISFQEPMMARSGKQEKWTARLRLSILGVIVLSVRKDHGKSIVVHPSDVEKLPAAVIEYLCLDPSREKRLRTVVQTGDQDSTMLFSDLTGRFQGATKVHPFEIYGTRKFRGGITIGSIVEGIDACATPVELEYPFTEEEYDRAVQSVENEVEYLWNETHGCDDCGEEGEFGGKAINPDCKTCHGEGTVI